MSPSGRVCLLTILRFILPTRGQTLEEATSISTVDPATLDTYDLTQLPGAVLPEVQPSPQTWTQPPDETSQPALLTETQQPTGMDVLLVTDPGIHMSSKEATLSDHPAEGTKELSGTPSPGIDISMDTPTPSSYDPDPDPDPDEDNPFYYDETTLRRRGLLVAAVLFITGIVILTSGKCRHLSQLCRNRCR